MIRSFQSRVFGLLLAMALVPTLLALAAGVVALREVGLTVGTLGPWDEVARSGLDLAEQAQRAAPQDPAVQRASEVHREALSGSLRQARLWSVVAGRVMTLLPVAGLVGLVVLGGFALLSARWLSRSLARPVEELTGWTERIIEGRPLPPAEEDRGSIEELAALRTSLRAMSERLEEGRRREIEAARLRTWTEMARRIAHELKNPLTPMRMAATALVRSGDDIARDSGEVLLEEIRRLDEMARTFSQFGRLPEGPPSVVDLEEMARTLARRHATGETPVRVVTEGDIPCIRGHHEVLSRALRNLVINALEACAEMERRGEHAGGEAEAASVTIVLERDGDMVRVAVGDRGPGILPELLETIWLPDVTTRSSGTGLGLALVRQAAEAHGGRVAARNRPGGGAEVEMALPLGPEEKREGG